MGSHRGHSARKAGRAGEDLVEAGQHLARAEALIDRAAVGLEEPFRTALQGTAAAVERIRRRLRAQARTSTAGMGGG